MSIKADQSDILAQLEKERGENATNAANVIKLTKDLESANAIAGRVPGLEAQVSTLTKERDDLKASNEKLTAETKDFNARLATELAKHGIRANGSDAPKRDEIKGDAKAEALIAEYNAITNPGDKARFLAKHEKELREIIKAN